MVNEKRVQLIVENFGPVRKGKVHLKPLTVFIGSNNSGKSYIAQLIYALTQGLRGRIPGSVPRIEPGTRQESQRIRKDILTLINRATKEKRGIRFDEFPASVRKLCDKWLEEMIKRMPDTLEEAIRDYFGCEDARELVRQDEHSRTLRVSIKQDRVDVPFLDFKMRKAQRKSKIEWNLPAFSSYQISRRINIGEFEMEIYDLADFIHMFMMDWWRSVLRENGIVDSSAYYLPAARSGILQGWQLFASMFAEVSRRSVGLRRLEVPPFSGVAGDFLQVLWERLLSRPYRLGRKGGLKTDSVLKVLEGDIFKGRVILEGERKEAPLLLYESHDMKIPLHRASSMVAELAPLDLWIKEILNPGNLLIIDEPEAHLHPASQRAIARVITRLVRAGVKVLVTTHSPLILQQLSNYIMASSVDEKYRLKYGIKKEDILKQGEVGVYLFKMTELGTQIKEVEIEEGFGISEEDFVRVYDEIGEETYIMSLEHPKNREDVHADTT